MVIRERPSNTLSALNSPKESGRIGARCNTFRVKSGSNLSRMRAS